MPDTISMQECREHIERFFASYGNPAMQTSAMKALRFLAAGDEPMRGKPESWAAGIYVGSERSRSGRTGCGRHSHKG